MQRSVSYLLLFSTILLIGVGFSNLGPVERTLGTNVRSVYLHGAWVWTALLGFIAAGMFGIVAILFRRDKLHSWSIALGRAGTFFWVTYLPLSLWTMQMNWNGLFLEEPRWRISIDFLIVGLLIQSAILIMQRPIMGSILNIAYVVTLCWTLLQTDQVMHPSSPIAFSDSSTIQFFFAILIILCSLAGWFLTKWFQTLKPKSR